MPPCCFGCLGAGRLPPRRLAIWSFKSLTRRWLRQSERERPVPGGQTADRAAVLHDEDKSLAVFPSNIQMLAQASLPRIWLLDRTDTLIQQEWALPLTGAPIRLSVSGLRFDSGLSLLP